VSATAELAPGLAGLHAEWEELAARTGASPFARPGWAGAWERAFAPGGVEHVTVRRAGELVALAAVRRRPGLLEGAANVHSPAPPALALDAAAARELAGALVERAPTALSLAMLHPEGALAVALRDAAGAAGRPVAERLLQRSPQVEVRDTWEAYAATRGRGLLSDLRRRSRRLAERGQVSIAEAGPEDARAAFEALLALEAASWKGARGTAMASRPATRRFYSEIVDWAAARGSLRLAVLRLEERPLAALLGLEEDGVHYLLKCAYDPAEAAHSPVKILLREAVEGAFERGLRRVELMGSAEPYKLAWATATEPRVAIQAFSGSPAGRAAWAAAAYARPLARRARLTGAVQRLRPS
jgi:CelD/BcsL family acetyltransferase involved in cellulose biosynthesis